MAPCANVCQELCNVCQGILLNIADSTVVVRIVLTHIKIILMSSVDVPLSAQKSGSSSNGRIIFGGAADRSSQVYVLDEPRHQFQSLTCDVGHPEIVSELLPWHS